MMFTIVRISYVYVFRRVRPENRHLQTSSVKNQTPGEQIRRASGPKACGTLSLGVGILTPIAMTIRVCPEPFGLELCRVNLPQATLENH